jgi:hypothetical protein
VVKAHLVGARRLDGLARFGQGTNRSISWFFLVWVFQDKSRA